MERQYLASTSLVVHGSDDIRGVEDFFTLLGAQIIKRKPHSITALIHHPDGFDTKIKAKYYEFDENYIELMRRSGDGLVFMLVYKMFLAFEFGRGEVPKLYPGQICPKLQMVPCEPSTDVPSFCLDSGEKRKRC